MSNITCALEADEIKAIRNIYEKKLALENLAKIIKLDVNPELYERLVSDYSATMQAFNGWWDDMFRKYQVEPGDYIVDFLNGKIIQAGVE